MKFIVLILLLQLFSGCVYHPPKQRDIDVQAILKVSPDILGGQLGASITFSK